MKKYRVYQAGNECKANGHDVHDLDYIKSQIEYIDLNPRLLGEFDELETAMSFAQEKSKNIRLYEFSSSTGRCFAFDFVYVESWDVEYDEDGDVEYEDSIEIYREFINED